MEVVREDLHHSIDIKDEDDSHSEYQEDSSEGTLSHSSGHSQTNKTKEIELNFEDLHTNSINIQDGTSVHLWKSNTTVLQKRNRGRNYTENEKKKVLNIASRYKIFIECKKIDAIHSKRKNDAWDCVAKQYNANCTTGPRNGQQLKMLYEILKKKAKKDANVEFDKTGGGGFVKKVHNTGEKVFQISGKDCGNLTNKYDSSAPLIESEVESLQLQGEVNNLSPILDESTLTEPQVVSDRAIPPVPSDSPTIKMIAPINIEEDVKLNILKCRREKGLIEKDILLLKRKDLELDIEIKKRRSKIELQLLELEVEERKLEVEEKKLKVQKLKTELM